MRAGTGVESYRAVLAEQMALAARQHATGEVEYLAAVSDDDTPALMSGEEPFAYYGTDRGTGGGWEIRITRTSVYSLLTADLAVGADFISPTRGSWSTAAPTTTAPRGGRRNLRPWRRT